MNIAERLAYNRRYSPQLNPLLFSDGELKPEIREKILQIVDAFLEYTQVSINIIDVRLVGSNASYNYNEYSDLDIHIVTVILRLLLDCTSIASRRTLRIHMISRLKVLK